MRSGYKANVAYTGCMHLLRSNLAKAVIVHQKLVDHLANVMISEDCMLWGFCESAWENGRSVFWLM